MFEMIAILGRGIQRESENGLWFPSEDLVVSDERSAHVSVKIPVDDDNPLCMVGGAELNLLAGITLMNMYLPLIVVCAYGARMPYLESIDAPSESEVVSKQLLMSFGNCGPADNRPPEVIIWERKRKSMASNTRQELLNIFDLALERGLSRIALVTVGVHVARTGVYIAKHLSVYEKYRRLSPVVLESEEILLAVDRRKYGFRVEALRNSKSFARNWEREAIGISKIVRDVYGDVKPLVAG